MGEWIGLSAGEAGACPVAAAARAGKAGRADAGAALEAGAWPDRRLRRAGRARNARRVDIAAGAAMVGAPCGLAGAPRTKAGRSNA